MRPATITGPGSPAFVSEIIQRLRHGSMVMVDPGKHAAGLCATSNMVHPLLHVATHEVAIAHTYLAPMFAGGTRKQYVDDLAKIAGAWPCKRSVPLLIAAPSQAVSSSWRRVRGGLKPAQHNNAQHWTCRTEAWAAAKVTRRSSEMPPHPALGEATQRLRTSTRRSQSRSCCTVSPGLSFIVR